MLSTMQPCSWADWAMCKLGGPASRWAATSNVEVGQTTYPVNRGRVEKEARAGSEEQSHKEEDREGRSRMGPFIREGELYLEISAGVLRSVPIVTPLLMGRSTYLARAGLKSQSAPDHA